MKLSKTVLTISGILVLFLAAKVSASDTETAQLWNDVTFDKFLRCELIKKLNKGRYERGAEVEVAYNSTTGEIWTLQRRIDIDNKNGGETEWHGSTKLNTASITFEFQKILILTQRLSNAGTTIIELLLPIDRAQLTVEDARTYWSANSPREYSGECVVVPSSEPFDWTLINQKI
jgi:hypothetical protein